MPLGGSKVRRRVWVKGRVQGVNFRYATKQVADQLRIVGWVKNLDDGRVEALFEGPPDAVERLIEWCKHGPPAARVDELQVRSEAVAGLLLRFDVLR